MIVNTCYVSILAGNEEELQIQSHLRVHSKFEESRSFPFKYVISTYVHISRKLIGAHSEQVLALGYRNLATRQILCANPLNKRHFHLAIIPNN